MSSFICEHCGKSIIDTPLGYATECEHYPTGPTLKGTMSVRRCDLASCRGDIDGCNGSECQNGRWRRMTLKQYRNYMGLDWEEPTNAETENT